MSHSHSWATRDGWAVCTLCGVVRNHDRPESPCRGPTKIALREATGGELGETAEMLEIVRLRRDLGDVIAARDEALTRCHTVARTLTDAIGASGFVALEEAARRAVEKLDGARSDAHRFREERDDLRDQLYRTREDLQARDRELDEARTELHEVRAKLEEAKRAAFVGWFWVCAARNWGFDPIIDHVKALLGVVGALTREGRS